MENKNIKCSFEEHKEINAISYCKNCNIYICNKCENNFHSKYLQNHLTIKLDKNNPDLFTNYCNIKNHFDKLKFYCKSHNTLCCSICICKIKGNEYGEHADCDVCIIEEIKENKKNILIQNINLLQNLSSDINHHIDDIKKIFQKIYETKEELMGKIQKIFTKIRNIINEKEDKLLIELSEKFEQIYLDENKLKKIEKLPGIIKKNLDKGKTVDKDWDSGSKLNSLINDCITIENEVKYIIKEIENMNKYNTNIKIKFIPEDEYQINLFLEGLNNFGKIILDDGDIFNISHIINYNKEYSKSLKKWINKDNIKIELLYRLSRDGDKTSKFHELCDNQGPTLTLFHTFDGNKVGFFTPLEWDKKSEWKHDMNTFLFSLNQNKKYDKINEQDSICCANHLGPYAEGLGCNYEMKRITHYSKSINSYFNKAYDILPSRNIYEMHYDLLELEVFKINIL